MADLLNPQENYTAKMREQMLMHQSRASKLEAQALILERQIRDLSLDIERLKRENAALRSQVGSNG